MAKAGDSRNRRKQANKSWKVHGGHCGYRIYSKVHQKRSVAPSKKENEGIEDKGLLILVDNFSGSYRSLEGKLATRCKCVLERSLMSGCREQEDNRECILR